MCMKTPLRVMPHTLSFYCLHAIPALLQVSQPAAYIWAGMDCVGQISLSSVHACIAWHPWREDQIWLVTTLAHYNTCTTRQQTLQPLSFPCACIQDSSQSLCTEVQSLLHVVHMEIAIWYPNAKYALFNFQSGTTDPNTRSRIYICMYMYIAWLDCLIWENLIALN